MSLPIIDFPLNPEIDDIYEQNGRAWIFDGVTWLSYAGDIKTVQITSLTGSATLPRGTTLERDVPAVSGYLRYNTDNNQFEGFSTTWGPLGGTAVVNDLITNTVFYPTLSTVTTGNITTLRTSSTKLSFNPSTGRLTATQFSGNGSTLTSLSAGALIGTIPGDLGVTAGSSTSSFVKYNGVTRTTGQFYGGTSLPSATTRLNYDGHFYATKLFGDGTAIVGAGSSLIDDNTTNTLHYLGMSRISSGTWSTAYVSTSKLYFNPSTGTLNSTNFNSLSDERYKENIKSIDNGLDIVNQINPVEFTWKDNGKKNYGVIAQQLEQIIPDIVAEDDGKKTVSYDQIIPFLVKAIKELHAEVEYLKQNSYK